MSMNRLIVAYVVCTGFSFSFPSTGRATNRAEDILAATGFRGGLVVHVGCGDGKLLAEMPAGDGFLIQGLDMDPANVEKARALIRSRGLCGQVSAEIFDGKHLPYIDSMVNLLVVEAVDDIPMEEMMRVLTPCGVAYVRTDGTWKKAVKPCPPEIDDWGQFLYDASGNPVGGDRKVGPPRRIQWECGPKWGRSHENMSSVSAVVSAGRRVFTIMDEGPAATIYHSARWFLTARDAFNGVALWKKRLDRWQTSLYPLKLGPFQLPRRLVAQGDTIYVTLGIDKGVSEISASTGEVLRTFDGTEATEEILYDQGKLALLVNNEKERLPYDAKNRVPKGLGRREFTVRVSGDRSVVVIDLDSGKTLWRRQAGNVTPVTLAAAGGRVFFHADEHVYCVDLAGGEPLWQAELGGKTRYTANFGPSLLVEDDVLCFGEPRRLTAVSALDGRTLWSVDGMISRCIAPISLCVIDGIVWAPRSMSWDTNAGFKKPSGTLIGYDLLTGRRARDLTIDVSLDIGTMHHRCCMPKATGKYVLTAWPGIEFIDTTSGKMFSHSWVRGACLYGAMPANGLIYAPPHPCACYPEGKLTGFQALAPARSVKMEDRSVQPLDRLERGPAYVTFTSRPSPLKPNTSADWPTHRRDAMRTGSATVSVPTDVEQLWQTELGGKLAQPVIAGGRLFVASVDAHTVHALDAGDGRLIWSYQTGGRIDSSPTCSHGMVLFGSRDGYVYSLDAETGQLVWRFHAARDHRQIVSYGQLESLWPVPGNVLVLNDTAYFVAGKSSFLDGGLWLYRVNPQTGEKLSETCVCSLDLEGRQPRVRGRMFRGLEMSGALPDVLSSDGEYIYLRHLAFDLQGQVAKTPGNNHIYAAGSFLDDSWFHRSCWSHGIGPISARSGVGQGQGGGARIMVMDDHRLFYFGRTAGVPRNHKYGEKYFLSSSQRAKAPPSKAILRKRGTGKSQPVATMTDTVWSNASRMHVRAMLLADQTLFVAGPKGDWMGSADVFEGRNGVALTAVSTADGKPIAEYGLPASPVFDGMAAAGEQLFVSLRNGEVVCWGMADR